MIRRLVVLHIPETPEEARRIHERQMASRRVTREPTEQLDGAGVSTCNCFHCRLIRRRRRG